MDTLHLPDVWVAVTKFKTTKTSSSYFPQKLAPLQISYQNHGSFVILLITIVIVLKILFSNQPYYFICRWHEKKHLSVIFVFVC